ncbi:unnamed protein product [Schistosoma haematobium]|nr:unnamed protein product [Schistosoma haematobium]
MINIILSVQSTEQEFNQDLTLIRKELRELDEWKPAPTLTETISSVKFSRKSAETEFEVHELKDYRLWKMF